MNEYRLNLNKAYSGLFLGTGILCAYMISLEKTEFVYKTFLETLCCCTNNRWRPNYCKADFEKAIHLG
jgi:hypothetical protein